MKIVGEIAKLIITLILSVLIIAAVLLNVANETILKEEYVLQKLEQSNYYETTYQEVLNSFDNYILQSGLEEDTLEGICSKEQVKEDTQKIIQNIYRGTKNKVDTNAIKEKLNAKIEEQLKDTIVTASTRSAIAKLVDTICKEYESEIMQTSYEQQINSVIAKVNNNIGTFKIILYIAIIVLVVLLVIISIKNQKGRILSWLGISILISGAMFIIVNIFIRSNITIEHITLLTQSISTALQLVLNDILSKLLQIGIIGTIVGIIGILLGNIIHSKN